MKTLKTYCVDCEKITDNLNVKLEEKDEEYYITSNCDECSNIKRYLIQCNYFKKPVEYCECAESYNKNLKLVFHDEKSVEYIISDCATCNKIKSQKVDYLDTLKIYEGESPNKFLY